VTTTQRVVNTLTLLRVRGSLVGDLDGQTLDAFRRAVDAVTPTAVHLAVDLSEVPSIDSEGVGELARALGRISGRGGRLALIAPSPAVRRILAVTRLDTAFAVLPSEQAAIDELAGGYAAFRSSTSGATGPLDDRGDSSSGKVFAAIK
jgi:anti-sigma B factor antagonist